jgi:hypothetical protein
MREAIIEKLQKHMSIRPSTEADVVYAPVQVRKLMERTKNGSGFPRLVFFCDWVVHGGLDRCEAKNVLIEIDDRLKHYDASKPWAIDPDGRVGAFLSHRAFLAELQAYLESQGINEVWTRDLSVWHTVSELYSEVIRDCPLEVQRKNYPFPYVSRLEISDCKPSQPVVDANPGQDHIGWKWTFTLSDGKTFHMEHTSSFGGG